MKRVWSSLLAATLVAQGGARAEEVQAPPAHAKSAPPPAAATAPAAAASTSAKSAPASAQRAAGRGGGPRSSSSTSANLGVAIQTHGTGYWPVDLFLGLFALGTYAAAAAALDEPRFAPLEDHFERAFARQGRARDDDEPYWRYRRRRHEAREGFLFAFGLGGGAMNVTVPSVGRIGALDFGLRLGYGFSDRFQLFGDFTVDTATYSTNQRATSWLLTARGQTVLVGDREGNGLNLNLGVGLGGLTRDLGARFRSDSGAGLALVSGLSYDARLSPHFSLSPELFVNWHEVPNGPGFPSDAATLVGVRLNFLWYAP